MKGSGIGGQAVMEGVMMKNGDKYAVAVRKPDNEIAVDVQERKALGSSVGLNKVPILRGVLAFIDSLILGVGTLTYSASFFEDDEDASKKAALAELDEESRAAAQRKEDLKEKAVMTGTVLLSIALAVVIFMLLPYFLSQLLRKVIASQALLAFLEGVLRVALFIGYVAAISLMKDIKRVFMYHGAEHKSINCIENGLPLTVENVRTQSRHHKRCGTSFLLVVMLISVLFFMFIQTDSAWLRLVLRLVLIPVIAGISYEFIKLAGKSDNKFVNFLSKPGMALQNLTTAEPDDSMIECAIASVEAVFDWKEFLEKFDETNRKDSDANADEADSDDADETSEGTENFDGAKTSENTESIDGAETSETVDSAEETESSNEPEVKEKPEVKNKLEVNTVKASDPSSPIDDEEEDEILKALDKYFILKKQKDSEQK